MPVPERDTGMAAEGAHHDDLARGDVREPLAHALRVLLVDELVIRVVLPFQFLSELGGGQRRPPRRQAQIQTHHVRSNRAGSVLRRHAPCARRGGWPCGPEPRSPCTPSESCDVRGGGRG